MEPPSVLLVEDDDSLRNAVARGLRRHCFTVMTARDGRSALSVLHNEPVDVIILDIGLPDADGRDVCQALRARGVMTPVVFMTARGETSEVLSGFSAGGDDYVAKPFEFKELVARLIAVSRRVEATAGQRESETHLDPQTHELVSAVGSFPLSPTEFRILGALMSAPGKLRRRQALMDAAWPDGSIVSDNTLDQYIARLRRKVALADPERSIVTVYGVGYRWS